MNEAAQDLMREATRLTRAGQLAEATAAIQRALGSTSSTTTATATPSAAAGPAVLDGIVLSKRVDTTATTQAQTGESVSDEKFIAGVHTDVGLTRSYKLYVPPGRNDSAQPLVVMLHGCTQNPDDFAIGTGSNELARERGCFVLYPAQAQDANPQRCWNWFKHTHQARGSGEPAFIASLTQSVMQTYKIDARRVFVSGLSAGGAMAAIVAATYPDIFAAACVHSGLPAGSARNVSEALAVMRSGEKNASSAEKSGARDASTDACQPVPTIVFHGDQDHTVHPRNGEQVVRAAIAGAAATATTVVQGQSNSGQRYTRSIHSNAAGDVLAEHWVLHGAGHAWSGGDARGSYTDTRGPNVTQEMLRFFMEHPQRPRS